MRKKSNIDKTQKKFNKELAKTDELFCQHQKNAIKTTNQTNNNNKGLNQL